ncbi:MAG TPA: amidohydrolase family protein [Gemmatimonadaceae bacterium]|nr:amidohydrolase family protein [Gemmatimonadaceae bacterium]
MTRHHATWVLPIAGRPIRDGWVAVEEGRVSAIGHSARPSADAHHPGRVAILPGLVNAHTHLELSHLHEHVPPSADFVTWIRAVVAARRRDPDSHAAHLFEATRKGIDEAVRCGTAVVGDISNTLVPFELLTRSPLAAVVFYELIRFNAPDPVGFVEQASRHVSPLTDADRVRVSLAAHAPYSVAPEVFRAIRQAVDLNPSARCSVHLSESADEVEFIKTGGGQWRSFLEDVGAWNPDWQPHGGSPVEYLDECGFLSARVLAVHGVQMSAADLARLAAHGTTLITCPRSNVRTGAGVPPVAEFYRSGVRVAIGTDSLASTPDLNVFAELAELRRLAPEVPASQLLDSATRQGARALGFEADYGTIEAGKRARLLAVTVPDAVDDVEEYLVSGIQPEQIRWLDVESS